MQELTDSTQKSEIAIKLALKPITRPSSNNLFEQ